MCSLTKPRLGSDLRKKPCCSMEDARSRPGNNGLIDQWEMLRRLLETWNDNYGTGGIGEVKYLEQIFTIEVAVV